MRESTGKCLNALAARVRCIAHALVILRETRSAEARSLSDWLPQALTTLSDYGYAHPVGIVGGTFTSTERIGMFGKRYQVSSPFA
jgi:hypothetical protein